MRRLDQPVRTRPSEKRAILGNEGLKIVNNNFSNCDWSLKIDYLTLLSHKEDQSILLWILTLSELNLQLTDFMASFKINIGPRKYM